MSKPQCPIGMYTRCRKIPQFDRNRANATTNTKSRSATSSYENTHHYAKAPKVDIARVMDVGSGEKKKNKTLPVTLPKKEKHEGCHGFVKRGAGGRARKVTKSAC